MTTLEDILCKVKEFEHQTHTKEVYARDLKLLDSGELQLHDDTFGFSPQGDAALAKLISCPGGFFQSVPSDLRATLTNRLLQEEERIRLQQIRVIFKDNQIIGLSDAKLIELSGIEVLRTVLDAMPSAMASQDLEVRSFHITEDALTLKITSQKTATELRAGDLVSAGLSIRHSIAGSHATQVSTYLHRLVCTNGMLVPVCRDDRRLRVRRLDGCRFSKQEMFNNLHNICQLAWGQLSDKLQALRALTRERIDPVVILRDIVRRMRLSREVAAALHAALEQDELGYDESQMAVINALSRIGSHRTDLSQALRLLLMQAAGVLSQENVHRCPAGLAIIYNERRN